MLALKLSNLRAVLAGWIMPVGGSYEGPQQTCVAVSREVDVIPATQTREQVVKGGKVE